MPVHSPATQGQFADGLYVKHVAGGLSPGGSDGKESAHDMGDRSSIPGSEKSPEKEMSTHSSILARKTHGWRNLAGYSPWVTKSQTRLRDFTYV